MAAFQIHNLNPTSIANSTDVLAIDDGTVTYKIPASVLASVLATIGNYMKLSGGTMTGDINMGVSGETATSKRVIWQSVDGTRFSMHTYNNQLQIYMIPSGGSAVNLLSIYSNGTVSLNAAAWRAALGITPTTAGVVLANGSYTFDNLAAGAASSATIAASIGTSNYNVIVTPNVARVAVGVQSRTSAGFDLYVRNVSPDTASPVINWTVIGLA